MKRVEKTFCNIAQFLLAILALVILYVCFLVIYPYKTIDLVQPINIHENKVDRGEKVTYNVEYEKFTDKQAKVRVTLIDEKDVFPVGTINKINLLDHNHFCSWTFDGTFIKGKGKVTQKLKIPEDVNKGDVYFVITISYKVNFLKTIERNFISDVIEVT